MATLPSRLLRYTLWMLPAIVLLMPGNAVAQSNARMQLLAKRAAKIDALRNLTETVYGLRIDSQTTVREFVTTSDVVRSRFSAAIRGAREVDAVMHDDGTAEVTVEITLGAVETILGRRIQYNQSTIEATGFGAPPSMPTGQSYNVPSSGQVARATGYGVAPDEAGLSSAERTLLGMRAAKVDAMRNLAEKVYQIQITSDSKVRDFAVQSDDVRARIATLINGATVVSEKKLVDGRYRVDIEVSIDPLRSIVGN